jgi:hypothetical protein
MGPVLLMKLLFLGSGMMAENKKYFSATAAKSPG